jgi:hypothetical protein
MFCFSIQLSNFLNAIYRQLAYFYGQIAPITRERSYRSCEHTQTCLATNALKMFNSCIEKQGTPRVHFVFKGCI